LSDLSPPFVHVVHKLGPHAPYGFGNTEYRTGPFFKDFHDPEDLRRRYRSDAEDSAETFLSIVETLEQRDLLEETLCVFTSDHGELLGQGIGGLWGHSTPLCPDLLTVPVVFLGAGLPTDEQLSGLISGVDIAPTCLSALGQTQGNVDGLDLWEQQPAETRRVRADVWQRYEIDDHDVPVYAGSALCEQDGIWVKHRRSRTLRTMFYLYNLSFDDHAPATRRTLTWDRLKQGVKTYGKRWIEFGTPTASQDEARAALDYRLERLSDPLRLTGKQEDHLRDLGYL
jgi:hypothetical protein